MSRFARLAHLHALVLAAAAAAPVPSSAGPIPVDLELALVIDVSGSVSPPEFALQRDGYVKAFESPAIQQQIADLGPSGGIAVSVFLFGTRAEQKIGWSQLTTAANAAQFASLVKALAYEDLGSTNIAGAIGAASAAIGLESNLIQYFVGRRAAIDVSGDGKQNTDRDGGVAGCNGALVDRAACLTVIDAARDAAAKAGIAINGLPITDDVPDLLGYYQAHVITSGGFALPARFENFEPAVQAKVLREVARVSEPGSLALAAFALAALAAFAPSRRARRAPGAALRR